MPKSALHLAALPADLSRRACVERLSNNHFLTLIQIDYQAIVEAGFYKTTESARVNFYKFSKRIGLSNNASAQGSAAAGASKKKSPTTPRKRKGKSPADAGADEGVDVLGTDETPKRQKKANQKPLVDGNDDGGDGDEDIVKTDE